MDQKPQGRASYYIHGNKPEEQERLSRLNQLLNDACLRELPLRPGMRILDLGSGLGDFSRCMAEFVTPGGSVLGIERDPVQLAAAVEGTAKGKQGLPVSFRPGDACHLPLKIEEWGSFDLAHARFVLEHIPRPEAVVSQMHQALRPGGRLVLADDDHANFRLFPETPGFLALWEAYTRSFERAGNDPFVGRRLVSLLHDAGLRDIRNTLVFFGGNAYQPAFPWLAENLLGILLGARDFMLAEGLITESVFAESLDSIRRWMVKPEAALWYGICWAEGRKPAE